MEPYEKKAIQDTYEILKEAKKIAMEITTDTPSDDTVMSIYTYIIDRAFDYKENYSWKKWKEITNE